MSTLEVKVLALQLGAAVDRLERRIDRATQQSLQATQALDQQAKQLSVTSTSPPRQVLGQIRQDTGKAIAEGVGDAMQDLDRTVRDGISQGIRPSRNWTGACCICGDSIALTHGKPAPPAP